MVLLCRFGDDMKVPIKEWEIRKNPLTSKETAKLRAEADAHRKIAEVFAEKSEYVGSAFHEGVGQGLEDAIAHHRIDLELVKATNPYFMRKLPGKARYRVYSKKRGKLKVHAQSTTKRKAQGQLRILKAAAPNPLTREEAADIHREAAVHRSIAARLERRGEGEGANYYAGIAEGMRDTADQYREHFKKGKIITRNPRGGKVILNPPVPGAVLIYDRVISISASKAGMKHRCDPECKRAGHRYKHVGIGRTAIWGMPNKKGLIFQAY